MTSLLLAALFFVGIHLVIAGTRVRDRLTDLLGEGPYLAVFSLLSLVGIVWLSRAYAGAEPMAPWWAIPGARHAIAPLVGVAFLLAAIGLATPSPTATGGEKQLDAEEPATGILRITRHPFLWGVALWAACHLLVNGDPPSVVLFGALLVLALAGPPSIDAKRARRHGERWERFAGATSNLPFAAIASGRNRLALAEIGWWRPLLGVVLYAGFFAIHAWLFGAAPY